MDWINAFAPQKTNEGSERGRQLQPVGGDTKRTSIGGTPVGQNAHKFFRLISSVAFASNT